MPKYASIEQAHMRLGLLCQECNQPAQLVPDTDEPVRYFPTSREQGSWAFIVGYPLKRTKLCSYHRRKKEGLFNTDLHYEEVRRRRRYGN